MQKNYLFGHQNCQNKNVNIVEKVDIFRFLDQSYFLNDSPYRLRHKKKTQKKRSEDQEKNFKVQKTAFWCPKLSKNEYQQYQESVFSGQFSIYEL